MNQETRTTLVWTLQGLEHLPDTDNYALHLEFFTGRGEAGLHWAGPALKTGQGSYFEGDPCPTPVSLQLF